MLRSNSTESFDFFGASLNASSEDRTTERKDSNHDAEYAAAMQIKMVPSIWKGLRLFAPLAPASVLAQGIILPALQRLVQLLLPFQRAKQMDAVVLFKKKRTMDRYLINIWLFQWAQTVGMEMGFMISFRAGKHFAMMSLAMSFGAMLKQAAGFLDKRSKAELFEIGEITKKWYFMSTKLVFDIVLSAVSLGVAAYIGGKRLNVDLLLAGLAATPVKIFIELITLPIVKRVSIQGMVTAKHLQGLFGDVFKHTKYTLMTDGADTAIGRVHAYLPKYLKVVVAANVISSLAGFIGKVADRVVRLFSMYLTYVYVVKGKVTFGKGSVVGAYAMSISLVMEELISLLSEFARGAGPYAPALFLFDTPRLVEGSKDLHAWGSLEMYDVEFAYPNAPSAMVLQDFTLKIEQGHHLGLVGPSGNGKSTVQYIILRLYDISAGDLVMNETSYYAYTLRSARNHIGYIPQEPVVLKISFYENICLGTSGVGHEMVRFWLDPHQIGPASLAYAPHSRTNPQVEAAAKQAGADSVVELHEEGATNARVSFAIAGRTTI